MELDNRFDGALIEQIQPRMEELGLTRKDDNLFGNETCTFKVYYNEAQQQYYLAMADLTGEGDGQFTDIQSVLFDDSQTQKDLSFVAIEFSETVRGKLGIRHKRSAALPTTVTTKNGVMNIEGFAKKVLDIFPQYKELYKERLDLYGSFLYLDFFADTLVPQIVDILSAGQKKTVKKLFELLESAYVQGDRDTVNVAVAVIAAAVYKKPELKEPALEMLADDSHFRQSVNEFIPVYAKRKKLIKALNK